MLAKPVILASDMEGVLIPEIWIGVAEKTGIRELRLTTRDVSDYDELMKMRIGILEQHGLKLHDIQEVIDSMEPLPGAREFVEWARSRIQFVVLSDTFYQFAQPMMKKLGWPTLFCHDLVVDEEDRIVDYTLRLKDQKRASVEAFKGLGFKVLAMGDSYNDTSMLLAADQGFFFKPPDKILGDFPQLPYFYEYDELKEALSQYMR